MCISNALLDLGTMLNTCKMLKVHQLYCSSHNVLVWKICLKCTLFHVTDFIMI